MRTNVTFRHPAEFVPLSDQDGILAVSGAQWFAALLRQIPGFEVDENLCQEDWGVVVFAQRNGKKFWIGLSAWNEDGAWLAHFHHGSFAWFQWISSSGNSELRQLLTDFQNVLANDAEIVEIAWHEESEMSKAEPKSFPSPVD